MFGKKLISLSLILVFILLLIAVLYVVYKLYVQENYFVEITKGAYLEFLVGDSKKTTANKVENFLNKIQNDNAVEVKLRKNTADTASDLIMQFKDVDYQMWSAYDYWVIYICEFECDWKKNNRWISFAFNGDKLSRIAEFERRRWELP